MENIKQRAREMFYDKFVKKAEQSYKSAVSDQVAPYSHQLETLLEVQKFINQIIDLAIAERDKEIVERIKKWHTHNGFEYEEIINLINNTNK